MPAREYDEVKAGIFVTLGMALLLGVVLWLGASGIFKDVAQQAVFFAGEGDGPVGLIVGSDVKVNDQAIGKVVEIRYDAAAGGTFYIADIYRDDAKVYSNGKANVPAALVGTQPLVVTRRGDSSAAAASLEHPLQISGQFIQAMNNLEKITASLATELDASNDTALLTKIKAVADKLKSTSERLDRATAKLEPELDPKNKDSIVAGVKRTVQRIDTYTEKDLAELITSLRKTGTHVLKISEDLRVISGRTRAFVDGNSENLDELVDNLTQVSMNLKAASDDVRRNPWRLLHTPTKEEIEQQNLSNAATAFMMGAAEIDQALAKLKVLTSGTTTTAPATAEQLKKVRRRLQEAFEKFNEAEDALYKELKGDKKP